MATETTSPSLHPIPTLSFGAFFFSLLSGEADAEEAAPLWLGLPSSWLLLGLLVPETSNRDGAAAGGVVGGGSGSSSAGRVGCVLVVGGGVLGGGGNGVLLLLPPPSSPSSCVKSSAPSCCAATRRSRRGELPVGLRDNNEVFGATSSFAGSADPKSPASLGASGS